MLSDCKSLKKEGNGGEKKRKRKGDRKLKGENEEIGEKREKTQKEREKK